MHVNKEFITVLCRFSAPPFCFAQKLCRYAPSCLSYAGIYSASSRMLLRSPNMKERSDEILGRSRASHKLELIFFNPSQNPILPKFKRENPMFTVYILQSKVIPTKIYIGYTKNLELRLKSHNAKKSLFSKRYAPWEVKSYTVFYEEKAARKYERYLKQGSGFAFLKRHLI